MLIDKNGVNPLSLFAACSRKLKLNVLYVVCQDCERIVWFFHDFILILLKQYVLLYCAFRVLIGYDEGTIMVKIGRDEPVASMDNSGKVIWAKHNEIQTVNIKSVGAEYEVCVGQYLFFVL